MRWSLSALAKHKLSEVQPGYVAATGHQSVRLSILKATSGACNTHTCTNSQDTAACTPPSAASASTACGPI